MMWSLTEKNGCFKHCACACLIFSVFVFVYVLQTSDDSKSNSSSHLPLLTTLLAALVVDSFGKMNLTFLSWNSCSALIHLK